ncbi:MAG: hydrogenase maturation factor [Clostridiales bacterium]|nr:hydrogenase maturation factor [Clostridiales bacterium]
MKIGKVPESVLKRSILKQIHTKREEVLLGADVGEDCAILAFKEDEAFVMSTDPITGTVQDIGRLAVQITANDIASAGAEPVAVMISALFPESITEEEIRYIMGQVEETCAGLHMQVCGGHTEVTDAVNRPVLTATGVGKVHKDQIIRTGGARPGQDVVVSKWIALEGTSILAKEKEALLLQKFPAYLVREAKNFDRFLSVIPEAATAIKSGVCAMHDVTEGGIFGALWELAESSGVGLEIDLKKIPVKQETIEICNYLDINPYELISSGAMLMAADNGYDLVRALDKDGIHASVIGKVTDGNDRVVINGEERRFLEPPKADALYKAL